jgi:hypothetical protein
VSTPYDGQERPVPVFDVLYGYAGPCAFCGFGDKRHRMADALVEAFRAGDSAEFLADGFDVKPTAIATLVAYADESKRRRRHRWEVRAWT